MDLRVRKTSDLVAESRGWLRGMHGTDPGSNPSVTLDISLFNQASHYPNGHIPSGIVVGKVDATGLCGPHDPAATDGRQNAYGLLFNSESVSSGQTRGLNAVVRHGNIDPSRLPIQTGTGSFGTAAKSSLPLIDWK